jgi:hypothetical protein
MTMSDDTPPPNSPDLTVNPGNSPFPVPAGLSNYGTVTIQTGGVLAFHEESTLLCVALDKSLSLAS